MDTKVDLIGNACEVGDYVVIAIDKPTNMVLGSIVRVLPKTVEVKVHFYCHWQKKMVTKFYLRRPEELVTVEPQSAPKEVPYGRD